MLKKHSNIMPWYSKPRPLRQKVKKQNKNVLLTVLFRNVPALLSQENEEDHAATPRLGWIGSRGGQTP